MLFIFFFLFLAKIIRDLIYDSIFFLDSMYFAPKKLNYYDLFPLFIKNLIF